MFNRVNGRRPLATSPSLEGTQETYTLAHEENVRFVSEGSEGPEGMAWAMGPNEVNWDGPRSSSLLQPDWAGLFLGSL